jgi:hypothetical protein
MIDLDAHRTRCESDGQLPLRVQIFFGMTVDGKIYRDSETNAGAP